jgi:hypothetical protein
MAALMRKIKALYGWPPGPSQALGYATIVTVAIVTTLVDTRWLIALLFWPILWLTRALITLLGKIPSAQQRRNEKHNLS